MNARKGEIIKKATELFSENGYDNTSTRELARAVNISIAGIYYFFQNKEEILFNIISSSIKNFYDTASSKINEEHNPQLNLKKIINSMVKYVVENKKEVGLLLKESHRLSREQYATIINQERQVYLLIKNEIIRLNSEGLLKDLSFAFVSFALLAIINFSYYWFDPNRWLTIEEFSEEVYELYLHGILK